MKLRRGLVLAVLLGSGIMSTSIGAGPSAPVAARPVHPASDPARGLVYEGLRPAGPGSRCRQGFEITLADGGVQCSHGPDPAPSGVDVRVMDKTGTALGITSSGPSLVASSAVSCVGDGNDGKRLQAMYVHGPGSSLDVSKLGSIRSWAAAADDVFSNSAAETGGNRRLRWVTDSGCNLDVRDVGLPTLGALDTMNATINAVIALGFNRTDRKYVMWVDRSVYCGIASIYTDDKPGLDNMNNGSASSLYARIDRGCWGQASSVEAHEIMHTLGAVQGSAPHGSPNGHCTDEYDRMCYKDASSVTMTYPCANTGENRFDCRHDDYFHTNPASGTYLATHWNAANSSWLYDPGGAAPPPPPPPPPPPSTTLVTDTFNGTALAGRNMKKAVTVGTGTTTVKLTLGKSQYVVLKLKTLAGVLVAKQAGTTPVQLSKSVSAGTYNVIFNAATTTSYTLEVTHPPAT